MNEHQKFLYKELTFKLISSEMKKIFPISSAHEQILQQGNEQSDMLEDI